MKRLITARTKLAATTCAALIFTVLISSIAFAGSVPNTFTAGTPAKAAEVNANFQYITDRVTPVGAVIAFAGVTAPAGWLLCDGNAVSRTAYAELYATIGTTHGRGDNVSTFNLPDYRGRFLRGVDGTADRDPNKSDTDRPAMNSGGNTGNNVGSVQGEQYKSHTHIDSGHRHNTHMGQGLWNFPGTGVNGFVSLWSYGADPVGAFEDSNDIDVQSATANIQAVGGSETRPVNAYVNWIIKY